MNKNKLELKHIQHYPIGSDNGLRCDISFTNKDGELIERKNKCITGIKYEGYDDYSHSVIVRIGSHAHNVVYLKVERIKPILRPMSDLTKPLEDGSVPLRRIGDMFFLTFYGKVTCLDNKLIIDDGGEYTHFFWNDQQKVFEIDNSVNFLTLESLEYLFGNHFDVFGLIEQGLAIDINSVVK